MRCKKHYTDYSSTVGVCACCLRERLLSLIAAQEQAQAQIQNPDGKHSKHRNSDQNPAIPRSVSPYVNNRRRNQSTGAVACSDSDYNRTDHHHHRHHRHSLSDQLFYRTPQVRPNSDGENSNTGVGSNKKRSFVRFLSFSNIFRSRNRKSVDIVSDLAESDSAFREPCGGANATSSPSLFSNIVHRSHHRRNPSVQSDESTVTATGGALRRQICRDRGMSPVRNSDEPNNATSENEFQSTESWKHTPRRTPVRRGGGGGGGHIRNLSGLTFCLSPLVRASPNRQWNQKVLPPDGVNSGEIRVPVKAHLVNAKLCQANRSRKLADFGRLNHNR